MNIIEQEDIVKGLPDAALQMEMQMPSGQIPEFLVLSEIQRRTDMRQRYAAQEPMPTATVKDQVMAQGLAAAAAPLSPVPAGPGSSLPALPVGDAQQGLAGMGVPMMAKGGKTESDFPDYSGDGEITKKDILIGRGVIPMQEGSVARSRDYRIGSNILVAQGKEPSDYPPDYVEAVGRSAAQQFYDLPSDSGLGELVRRPAGSPEEVERINQQFKDSKANMPTTEEMISRYEALEESGYNPRIGPPGIFAGDAEETAARRAARDPLVFDDEFTRSLQPAPQRIANVVRDDVRKGVRQAQEDVDFLLPRVGSVGTAGADFITTLLTGTDDPQGLRRELYDDIERAGGRAAAGTRDAFRAAKDYVSNIDFDIGKTGFGLLPEDVERSINERLSFLPSDQDIANFGMDVLEYGGEARKLLRGEGNRLGFLPPELIEAQRNASPAQESDFLDGIKESLGQFFTSSEEPSTEAILADGSVGGAGAGASAGARNTDLGRAEANLADGSGVGGGGGSAGSGRGTDNFLPAALLGGDRASQSPFMEEAYSSLDELRTGQADVQTNLQDLITQTQQDAKNRALYAGVMGLAQGIAAGDMAKGLERAGDQAGRIMAASETAVAPLRAAQAVAPTENLKAQIDAITDLARADATYQSVSAQFRREEGLDNRKEKDLMIAATRMVDEVFEEGVFDYPDVESAATARAAAVRQIYNELSAMYGDSLIRERSTPTLDTNPETGNLRYSP